MKPTLEHKPSNYTCKDLLIKFANGIPLSCDQLNFLYQHEKALSNPHMDPVLKYYLKHYHHDHVDTHSFLLPRENLTAESIHTMQKRLGIILNGQENSIQLKLTPEQFMKFKAVTYHELILYHGNQFLSGAPFHAGGVPHLIYFQWGNLFGVAKYVVMAEEKALKTNVLIYFEDMQERLLAECVLNYQQHVLQKTHQPPSLKPPAPQPEPQHHHNEQLRHQPSSVFKTPTLTLSQGSREKEETK